MKSKIIVMLLAGLTSFSALAQDTKTDTNAGKPALIVPAEAPNQPTEAPDKKKLSYAFGVYFARYFTNSLHRQGIDATTELSSEDVALGVKETIAGSKAIALQMTDAEVAAILKQESNYKREQVISETKRVEGMAADNKAKSIKFIEENALAPGVKVLADGLQYKVIKEGEGGEHPAANDLVTVSFSARLVDGTEVQKIEHGETPMVSRNLPPGMTEALMMMQKGSKWTVYLPYTLAYGDQTAMGDPEHAPKIGPFSALVYDMELDSFRHAPAGMTAPTSATQAASGQVIRVPSTDELKRGSNVQALTAEEVQALIRSQSTNSPK